MGLTRRVRQDVKNTQQLFDDHMEKEREKIDEEQEMERARIEREQKQEREDKIKGMKNDMYCYFDELTDEDVTRRGRIITKFRRSEARNGYGYGNIFSAECLGTDNTDVDEDDYYYGCKVFT